MARYFFFYGTLRHDIARGHSLGLVEQLAVIGPAIAAGRLFAKRNPRGTYPVLVRGTGRSHGIVCQADAGFSASTRTAMDRYEGREYVRQSVPVRLEGGVRLTAEAYFYIRPLKPALVKIANGDLAHFLAATGERPFA